MASSYDIPSTGFANRSRFGPYGGVKSAEATAKESGYSWEVSCLCICWTDPL